MNGETALPTPHPLTSGLEGKNAQCGRGEVQHSPYEGGNGHAGPGRGPGRATQGSASRRAHPALGDKRGTALPPSSYLHITGGPRAEGAGARPDGGGAPGPSNHFGAPPEGASTAPPRLTREVDTPPPAADLRAPPPPLPYQEQENSSGPEGGKHRACSEGLAWIESLESRVSNRDSRSSSSTQTLHWKFHPNDREPPLCSCEIIGLHGATCTPMAGNHWQ